jgi:hypothetical protein
MLQSVRKPCTILEIIDQSSDFLLLGLNGDNLKKKTSSLLNAKNWNHLSNPPMQSD